MPRMALMLSPPPEPHALACKDAQTLYVFPRPDKQFHDMRFSRAKPDCAAMRVAPHCVRFPYTDASMELPVMLFRRGDSDLGHDAGAGLSGCGLYQPAWYFTHVPDRGGRRWLRDVGIDLVKPEPPEACFEALIAGEVDAVPVNLLPETFWHGLE